MDKREKQIEREKRSSKAAVPDMGGKKEAVLVSLTKDFSEMEQLMSTLGYSARHVFHQARETPHPKQYVGTGKLEEIRNYVDSTSPRVQAVFFNTQLKPPQVYYLAEYLKVEIFDRIRLLLDIFTSRAVSVESKLQIELSRIQYEMPILKEYIHQKRKGEHPGPIFSSGEYEVDYYYIMAKRRMKRIRDDLEKTKVHRETSRKHRRRQGFFLASLAGYTNAGKSSLLNALTSENVLVEDRVFSTLSTTTRRITCPSKEILVTDTVGFIEDMPPWLIEAFHSTLEEIFLADTILLVADASDDIVTLERKLDTSLPIIKTGQDKAGRDVVDSAEMVVVLNKIDMAPPEALERARELATTKVPGARLFATSCKRGDGIAELKAFLVGKGMVRQASVTPPPPATNPPSNPPPNSTPDPTPDSGDSGASGPPPLLQEGPAPISGPSR